MVRLCHIALVLSGLNPEPPHRDPCKFIQIRDLTGADRPLLEGERPSAARAHSVEPRDVLLAARGERSVAVRPRSEIIGAYVTLDVYLIKPDVGGLDPDYLAAFLTRPDIGLRLRASTAGAALPRIPKGALAGLELPLPDLDRQRASGGLFRSFRRRAGLYDRLRQPRIDCSTIISIAASPNFIETAWVILNHVVALACLLAIGLSTSPKPCL